MGLSYIGLLSCTVSIIDISNMDMLYCYYYYNIIIDEVSCGGIEVYVWRYLERYPALAVCIPACILLCVFFCFH